ncbi:MAG TPA: hypothetical protein VMS21_01190 [Methylomirabilota bacterium]|nr:hypothetical protein [Methylomirabilota bacterium]
MNTWRPILVTLCLIPVLMTGCRETPVPEAPEGTSEAGKEQAVTPVRPPELPPEESGTRVEAITEQARSMVSGLSQNLVASARATSDDTLASIGEEIQAKVIEMEPALSTHADLRQTVEQTLKALAGGEDSEVVGLYGQLTEAKLTPEQTELAGDFKDVLSAFVVQRNFAGVDGAEGEVSQIVSAFRDGNAAGAIVPLQGLAGKASLTPGQKELVSSLAESYAPALKGAGEAVQEGVKSLNNLLDRN